MERYIKANRKVVELLQLTEDRTELQDGNFILWCQDILQLGEPIEFEETLSRIGAIAMDGKTACMEQDEGADYIMTQLCWDMDQFRYWMDAIRAAGIWMPVDVGIMPVLDAAATINMALSRNGCVMSRDLCEIISKNWIFPNPFAPNESEESIAAKKASFKEAGIEYTIKLIDEYRVCGINGIHLYALNKYDDVARIVKESGIVDLI